ncbi:MAG: hypothetical protein VYC33_00200 [Candidatus Thermoplasmatota archaeon]|nr:hypothetical protein [Candidatus Thermoplasmatota archaeon]
MDADLCTRSLRELARRILRSRGVIFSLPSHIERDENLGIRISDLSPSLYFGIEFKHHDLDNITVTNIGESGGRIGIDAPVDSEVWVPLDLQIGFDILIEEVIAMASAGYPACAGCGGSDAETPWDELSIRKLYF